MANTVVISRIQNRRGRRENLPQPLLPGEIALTADTNQAWIGGDPNLAVPSIQVYADKSEITAQSIVDNNIVEAVFTQSFVTANFNTLVSQLEADSTVTLTADDILWDDTFRGIILSITVSAAGTGYTTGDAVTAVSATGSGFVGTVVDDGSGGIQSVTITSGGQNYFASTTTFTIAGGTGGSLSVAESDIYGTSVLIAADPSVDSNNTIANVDTAVSNTSPGGSYLISSGALGGTFTSGLYLTFDNTESTNLATLVNKVNASTPSETTGLVRTTLNVELTNTTTVFLPYEVAFFLTGTTATASEVRGRFTFTQSVIFQDGTSSRASCGVVSTATQDFDLQKNGTSFGTVSFATGSATATITIGSATTFIAGDVFELIGPATPDGTQDYISITIAGEYQAA